jgi:hypothetical protein
VKKKQPLRILIGILCVLALAGAVVLALYLDSLSPDPIFGVFPISPSPTEETTLPTEETTLPPEPTAPAPTGSSTVTLPEEDGAVKFPCQVPGYGLTIEKVAPYSGMYVENGSNVNTNNVAMLMVHNNGDYPIEYTQICVEYADQKLIFDISALPVGEKLVVQEKNGKAVPEGAASAATALVVQRAQMSMSETEVRVTDNGDNTLTVENLTDKTIPTVRVFYKYYMEDQGIFVGGIAFTVRVTRLAPGAKVTLQPSHYTSATSRVVMVLTYDSEV